MTTKQQVSGLGWEMPTRALIFLIPCLVLPSLPVAYRYAGTKGAILFALAWLLIVPLLVGVALRWFLPRLSNRATYVLLAIGMIAVAVLFAVVYPIAQSGKLGPGSDGDDALNLGISELLHGRYPYYPKTYLGNPISPMPGMLLLGMPFFLLFGNAAYQNIFWLWALCGLVIKQTAEPRMGLLALLVLVGLSPGFTRSYVVGSDYTTNTIYVLVFIQFLVWTAGRSSKGAIVSALMLGVALSSRANFILLLPLVFVALLHRNGRKQAAWYTAIAGITAAGMTLPFILYDVHGFSPFHTANKLRAANDVLPHADWLVSALTLVVLALVCARRSNVSDAGLFRHCALVQLVPPLSLFLIGFSKGNLEAIGAFSFSLFYAVLGIYSSLLEVTPLLDRLSARPIAAGNEAEVS